MQFGPVRIIYNPISGRGHSALFISELVRHLTMRGFQPEPSPTRHAGHAAELARGAPDDAAAVISIGGDGTHREVLGGLIGRGIPACIVPGGTENVMARTLRLTGTLPEVVETVHHGRIVAMDMGRANGRPFAMFSGVGFDAEVTREVHSRRRGPIVRGAYYGPIVRRWWRYGFPPFTVTVDGRLLADDVGILFICNTPEYADRLRLAPRAAADDGLLDVVAYRTRSRYHMLAHMIRTRLGRHLDHPLVAYAQGKRIEVTCPEREVAVQTDGDVTAATPVTYTVEPLAVRLILPPERPGRNA